MRVAAIQTTAGPDPRDNLQTAADLVRDAADVGSQLVVLPELFSVAGTPEHIHRHAEDINGPTVAWAAELADQLRIHLVAGSFPERGSDGRVYNTSCLLGPTGSLDAVYRKVHLFDVHIGDTEVHESGTFAVGDSVAVAPIAVPADGQPAVVKGSGDAASAETVLGLSICYDLRFPELFRVLVLRGATVVAVPSAFTVGHWPRPLGAPGAGAGRRQSGLRDCCRSGRTAATGNARLPRSLDDRRSVGHGTG